ncbi:G protein-regulated inducer of neurite outgrowth 2 [Candoia aspera]|uniref:G protein-regulated inducer of neurite outgrowth 2 n=1 Tax=Candoia aspera TaxID=51853 RepID=UPI002FD83D43
MANKDHQLHNHSQGAPLNDLGRNILSVNGHPLSKSSTDLEGVGQGGFEESQRNRRGLRKSCSSSVCQAQEKGTAVGRIPSSLTHLESTSTARTTSSLSPQDTAQPLIRHSSHVFRADQPPASEEGRRSRTELQSSPGEKFTPARGASLQQWWAMEGLGTAVQRSLSDLTCSCKQPSPTFRMEASATSPAICPNSSNFASADKMVISGPRYGVDTYEDGPDFQSHVIQIPGLSRGHNVPANTFHQGATSHHVAIFTDPRASHATVLGSSTPSFSNRAINTQGGIVDSSFSTGVCPPGMVTIHNGTPLPYNISHASAVREEGTMPAYCHSLPIPSLQFTPRLVCPVNEPGKEQVNPLHCTSLLATEASSVNRSGLEAKHFLRCCGAHGEGVLNSQPSAQASKAQEEMKTMYVVLNSHQDGVHTVMKTKDTWTMTSMNDITQGFQTPLDCRDAQVQTFPATECKSVATSPSVLAEGHPHVFPEISLKPEAEGEKSPVREVRWDDEGMTWEVYGAAVDPEVLGLAIQKHLEIQIEQFQTEPAELSGRSTEEQPAKEEKRISFEMVMHCLRNPTCCARSSLAVE